MSSVGDVIPLTIEKPAAGGRMLARVDRLVVLVSGAIPGERVRAVVERIGKGVVYAAVAEIDEPSIDRRAVVGDPLCGGCAYAHIAYQRQLEIKSLVIADAFARIGRIILPSAVAVASSPDDGYRMRARLHVREGRIGFFREGTHDLCDPRATRQLLPATCDALEQLASTASSRGVGGLRGLDVAENVDASQRIVALDLDAPVTADALDRLAATAGVTGVSSAFGTRGEIVVSDVVMLPDGPSVLLQRHPLAFFQGNRYLLAPFVAHVMAQVPAGGEVLDLYAGVGLFSLAASVRGSRVTAVEGDRIAAADLAANARDAKGTVVGVHQPVETFLRHRRTPSSEPLTLIVDPPRTGMSREALDGVVGLGAARIVYVSCDVATLARDLRRLMDEGYRIVRTDAFDLFPNTPHVETVVVLDR